MALIAPVKFKIIGNLLPPTCQWVIVGGSSFSEAHFQIFRPGGRSDSDIRRCQLGTRKIIRFTQPYDFFITALAFTTNNPGDAADDILRFTFALIGNARTIGKVSVAPSRICRSRSETRFCDGEILNARGPVCCGGTCNRLSASSSVSSRDGQVRPFRSL